MPSLVMTITYIIDLLHVLFCLPVLVLYGDNKLELGSNESCCI